uniref:Arrestin-like N-terminal domain-containing protein n=1 Tax=Timema monikensis TaxID=170555 RepID=A0A7R9DY44_9NEOP|nr:unnamed protein product [Timema monikensis]
MIYCLRNCKGNDRRVFKKSAPNNKLTLYLASRDLVISEKKIDKLQGVLLVDPDYLQDRKVFGQVTLTFRYGREDEEVMGLKFCNEAVMCLAQLYPCHERAVPEPNTPLQNQIGLYSVRLDSTRDSPVCNHPKRNHNGMT